MIAIIQYGSGNVGAIATILKRLRVEHVVTGDRREIERAERYILPGVGAFDATMTHLAKDGLLETLSEQVLVRKKKVLGVCVGMQVLAERSEEGNLPGLGWLRGEVRRIDESTLTGVPRLPHMGWNSIAPERTSDLLKGVDPASGFYFLHSFHLIPADPLIVTATVEYGSPLVCAVEFENIYAVQFHPEKSHSNGTMVFKNFVEMP